MKYEATVLITTRDRCQLVTRAVESAEMQSIPVEILVLDDGSIDGTAETLRARHPEVTVLRSDISTGCVAQRNVGVRQARGRIVFTLDDDAYFTAPETVERVVGRFQNPALGAVALPYINVRRESYVRQKAPGDGGRYLTGSFAGGVSAIRREAFLKAGGYRADFGQQGEERELALRLLDLGYEIELGTTPPVIHDEALVVKQGAAFYFSARNELLITWSSIPIRFWPVRLAEVVGRTMLGATREGKAKEALAGLGAGLTRLPRELSKRRAVRPATYRHARRLQRRGPYEAPPT